MRVEPHDGVSALIKETRAAPSPLPPREQREDTVEAQGQGVGINPTMTAPRPPPVSSNSSCSPHLQTPSRKGVGLHHMSFGVTQTFSL